MRMRSRTKLVSRVSDCRELHTWAIPHAESGSSESRQGAGCKIDLGLTLSNLLNSLTPISFPAGTKNSLSEDFLLAKHKDTNIPTMMEPFSSPSAWF
jgi:hypothetical protein